MQAQTIERHIEGAGLGAQGPVWVLGGGGGGDSGMRNGGIGMNNGAQEPLRVWIRGHWDGCWGHWDRCGGNGALKWRTWALEPLGAQGGFSWGSPYPRAPPPIPPSLWDRPSQPPPSGGSRPRRNEGDAGRLPAIWGGEPQNAERSCRARPRGRGQRMAGRGGHWGGLGHPEGGVIGPYRRSRAFERIQGVVKGGGGGSWVHVGHWGDPKHGGCCCVFTLEGFSGQ